jgi:hypothetical protein
MSRGLTKKQTIDSSNQVFYRPKCTKSIDISAGETPLILDACPIVEGFTLLSFSRASLDNALRFL